MCERVTANPEELPPRVVLFDGLCHLCCWGVRFIIARDPRARFCFLPLQSERGRALMAAFGRDPDSLETAALVEEGRLYDRSTAALRIARHLRFPWPLLGVFVIAPRFARDLVYRLVARLRYRLFGKRELCMVPGPGARDRFLQSS